MGERPDTPARIAGLDGLRGLAALAVFGVHFNQVAQFDHRVGPFDSYRLLANGEGGVALFFILSGLLLGLPFWSATGAGAPGRFDLRTYVLRRLARVVPAYFLALTVLVVIEGLWRIPTGWWDILLHYTFLHNYAEFSIFSINAPFWTLAVEMQFYALLPLLFFGLRRLASWRIALILLMLGVLAWVLNHWLISATTRTIHWPSNPWLIWIRPYGAVVTHSLLAHLPHFLIGVTGGWLFVRLRAKCAYTGTEGSRMAEGVFLSCLTLIVLLLGTPAEDAIQIPYGRYGLPLIPLLLGALVLAAPFARASRRVLDSPPLRGLGLRSYGLYIYHLPCLNFVDRRMAVYGLDAPEHWLIFGSAGFALSLVVASLSYTLVERPVLAAVRRLHGRPGT